MSYCVTVTPTIMSGTVVRWFPSEEAMRSVSPAISASRDGVMGHGGHYLTPDLFQGAWDAHLAIKRGDTVAHLATHRHAGLFSGEYERIEASA